MITDDLKAKTDFTAIECQIADLLLVKRETIRGLSARAIAREVPTAPSSVVRLCQRLGFDGYQDFRHAWLDELRYLASAFAGVDANRPFRPGDDVRAVAVSIGGLYLETIQDTLGLLDDVAITYAAEAIARASSIVVVSLGAQADIAADFVDKMLHIGRTVTVEPAADRAYYRARGLQPGDVLVAVSYSGETAGVLRAAAAARRQGAHVVAITSFGTNSLAQLATSTLRVSTRERLVEKVGSYAMSLATLLLLDIIYSEVFHLDHEANLRRRTALGHDYERRRDSSHPLLRDRWRTQEGNAPG